MKRCAPENRLLFFGLSIWAIIKRQAHGTHHKMSPQYLPLYLAEISYRFNHRDDHKLFLKVLRNTLLIDKQIA